LKLPTVLLFVEFNTTMAVAILAERDFVGEVWVKAMDVKLLVVMQSFSVTPCSSADTA